MNMTELDIEAVIGEDGVLDLKTKRPLRVRLNGRVLNGVTGVDSSEPTVRTPTQKFWQPDGTQSDSAADLRGEQR